MNPKVKVGDTIRIIKMEDKYAGDKYNGKIGKITHIDSIGQLHGNWGGLAVIPDLDTFEIVK